MADKLGRMSMPLRCAYNIPLPTDCHMVFQYPCTRMVGGLPVIVAPRSDDDDEQHDCYGDAVLDKEALAPRRGIILPELDMRSAPRDNHPIERVICHMSPPLMLVVVVLVVVPSIPHGERRSKAHSPRPRSGSKTYCAKARHRRLIFFATRNE